MAASAQDIQGWFDRAVSAGATHLVVVCDTFEYEDYPVMVMPGESVEAVVAAHSGKNMEKVMEVYALHLPREAQMAEGHAMHLETSPELEGPPPIELAP